MAGKGDKWRKTNFKKYFDNWEKIKPSKSKDSERLVTWL